MNLTPFLLRNKDELHKLGKRVHREAIALMKEAKKRAVDEVKRETTTNPLDPPKATPPKLPEPPKVLEPPKPPKPPEPSKPPQ